MASETGTFAFSPEAPTAGLNLANLLYETKGAIAYVTVNRPKRKIAECLQIDDPKENRSIDRGRRVFGRCRSNGDAPTSSSLGDASEDVPLLGKQRLDPIDYRAHTGGAA